MQCKYKAKKFEYFQNLKLKKYNLFKNKKYYRYYSECNDCSHWNSNFKLIQINFMKIIIIKVTMIINYIFKNFKSQKEDSDNYYRSVNLNFKYEKDITKILDVGSGLRFFHIL